MRFASRWSLLLSIAIVVLPDITVGQQTGKQLLEQAYAKTKSAKTTADYTLIIDLCDRAEDGELTPGPGASGRSTGLLLMTYL